MRYALPFFTLLALTACRQDETISAFVPAGSIWHLTDLNGQAFPANGTLTFPEPGIISGNGPCNTYSASQNAPYPWFEAGPIRATKRTCPEQHFEGAFLLALAKATLAEVSGDILILSDEGGGELVFRHK